MLLVYSTSGQHLVQGMSWDAKDPKRNIPLAIIGATIVILILYVSVSFVAGNVLPVAEVAGQPLTFAARQIFPSALYPVFIICGPIMALVTNLNSSYASISAPVQGAIRNGWLPSSWAKTNKYDMPIVLYTVIWILSIIPMLLGVSLSTLTSYTVMTTRICGTVMCLGMLRIPVKFKDAWEKSWLHIPDPVYYALGIFSLVSQVLAVLYSAKSLGLRNFLVNMVLVAVLAAYVLVRHAQGKVHSHVTCEIGDEVTTEG